MTPTRKITTTIPGCTDESEEEYEGDAKKAKRMTREAQKAKGMAKEAQSLLQNAKILASRR